MKKIITSAGIVALGVAGVQAEGYLPGFSSPDQSRPWSVSATLQGFYDDNYNTAPGNSPAYRSSWGFEALPSASLAYSAGPTDIAMRYTFGVYYYADRASSFYAGGTSPEDYSHQFDLTLNHNFSTRENVVVTDSFVYSSEPQLLYQTGSAVAPTIYPFRTLFDNYRNVGAITFNSELTKELSLALAYQNTFNHYNQNADNVRDPVFNPSGGGSLASLLNDMEHLVKLDLRWQMLPDTTGVVGYQFGLVNFTDGGYLLPDYAVAGGNVAGGGPRASSRDSYNHYIYIGADHTFNPAFTVSGRVGAEYTDSYNLGYTAWNPYANLNLQYNFGTASFVQFGFTESVSQTYVVAANASSSVVYASVNYRFTPKLTGSLLGQFQDSKFNGAMPGSPNYSGLDQQYWLAGVNLTYQFNHYLAANLGYNFDALRSPSTLPAGVQNGFNPLWDYTRNRVYFGITATY